MSKECQDDGVHQTHTDDKHNNGPEVLTGQDESNTRRTRDKCAGGRGPGSAGQDGAGGRGRAHGKTG